VRVLVTGGSMGIGLAVSRALAQRGARVVIASRGTEALAAALAELGGEGSGHQAIALDVADQSAWEQALHPLDAGGPLDGLVAAAGVLGPIGSIAEVPARELVATVGVNLIGTMLALHYGLPRLRQTGGRAVTFSGGGAAGPLPRYDAYAASKAAVVRLSENVAAAGGTEVNAVAPGFVATRMHDGTLRAGPDAAGPEYFERTRRQLCEGGFPADETAGLVCFLLSEEARGISGRLISAQWDPWRDEGFRARLRADDSLARLRRIDEQFFARVTAS
jgi:3-oxoacyl-[acyl-carrier protein] reductase